MRFGYTSCFFAAPYALQEKLPIEDYLLDHFLKGQADVLFRLICVQRNNNFKAPTEDCVFVLLPPFLTFLWECLSSILRCRWGSWTTKFIQHTQIIRVPLCPWRSKVFTNFLVQKDSCDSACTKHGPKHYMVANLFVYIFFQ